MPLVLGGSSAAAAAAYSVDNSCMFNSPDSSVFSQTQSTSPTHDDKATVSLWFKPSAINVDGEGFGFSGGDDASNRFSATILGSSTDTLYLYGKVGGSLNLNLLSYKLIRDPSAWYHLVVAVDTTQGVEANRVRVYLNNEEVTSWSATTYPSLNDDCMLVKGGTFDLGCIRGGSWQQYDFCDGYMAECVLIDGQQLTPSSFGEANSDSPTIWQPKEFVDDVTFGTNGFYIDFKDSAALGNDVSGNNNDFTPTNIVAGDQSVDTPTNNFCTLTPLTGARTGYTWSYGNTKVVTPSTQSGVGGTMGVSNGKWYFETLLDVKGSVYMGWQDMFNEEADNGDNSALYWNPHGSIPSGNTGDIYIGGGSGSGFKAFDGTAASDYFGFGYDADNLKLWWSRNGQWYTANASPATTLTRAEVAANTDGYDCTLGTPPSFNANSRVGPFIGNSTNTQTSSFNFGNGRFAGTALTGTTYTDNNGQGIFKYEPPDGFRAICSKNLGEFG